MIFIDDILGLVLGSVVGFFVGLIVALKCIRTSHPASAASGGDSQATHTEKDETMVTLYTHKGPKALVHRHSDGRFPSTYSDQLV
jgi:hypothetical protein